jgi:hypothetical protein
MAEKVPAPPNGKEVDPPYLTAAPGQIGANIDNYGYSLMGFASGKYPNGEDCPEPDYLYHSNTSGEDAG